MEDRAVQGSKIELPLHSHSRAHRESRQPWSASMNIIRRKATAKKVGVTTVTVDRWSNDPKYAHLNFPKPIPLGDNSVGHIEEEIDDWLAKQAAKREAPDAMAS